MVSELRHCLAKMRAAIVNGSPIVNMQMRLQQESMEEDPLTVVCPELVWSYSDFYPYIDCARAFASELLQARRFSIGESKSSNREKSGQTFYIPDALKRHFAGIPFNPYPNFPGNGDDEIDFFVGAFRFASLQLKHLYAAYDRGEEGVELPEIPDAHFRFLAVLKYAESLMRFQRKEEAVRHFAFFFEFLFALRYNYAPIADVVKIWADRAIRLPYCRLCYRVLRHSEKITSRQFCPVHSHSGRNLDDRARAKARRDEERFHAQLKPLWHVRDDLFYLLVESPLAQLDSNPSWWSDWLAFFLILLEEGYPHVFARLDPGEFTEEVCPTHEQLIDRLARIFNNPELYIHMYGKAQPILPGANQVLSPWLKRLECWLAVQDTTGHRRHIDLRALQILLDAGALVSDCAAHFKVSRQAILKRRQKL